MEEHSDPSPAVRGPWASRATAGVAIALALALNSASTPALAREPSADEVVLLGSVTITGTRLGTSAPGIAVVGAPEFERFDHQRLTDALATVPGLVPTAGSRGSPRNEARVFLRGFDGLQTPFLVDGVPFYVSWDGEPADLDRFTLFDLAAVEVAKGYVPVAYGPGTLGGAINLVTRRPVEPFEADFQAALSASDAGDEGWRAAFNLGARRGAWYAQLGASYVDRDEWRLPDDFRPAGAPVLVPLTGNLQPAGARLRSASSDRRLSLKLGVETQGGGEYALAAYEQRAEKGVPPYAGPPDTNQRFNYFDWPTWSKRGVYLLGQTPLADGMSLRTRLYWDAFENELFSYAGPGYSTQATPRAFRSRYDDYALGGSVVLEARLGPGTATAAAHLRDDYHDDIQSLPGRNPPRLRFEDRTWSVGAEYRLPFAGAFEAAVAASRDARDARRAQDSNRAGAELTLDDAATTNLQAQLALDLDALGELRASVARRGRFPSQFERYSYRLGSAIPNPELALERATTIEVGHAWRTARWRSDAAAFTSRLEDLIQPVMVSPGVTQNRNVGAARYTGFEWSLAATVVERLQAGFSYTYLERESRSTPRRILFGVPRHAAFAWAEWRPLEALEVVPSVTLNTRRRTSDVAAAGGEPVGGFATCDLRVAWRALHGWRIEVVGRNLADRLYALDLGYPREGRSYALVVRGDLR